MILAQRRTSRIRTALPARRRLNARRKLFDRFKNFYTSIEGWTGAAGGRASRLYGGGTPRLSPVSAAALARCARHLLSSSGAFVQALPRSDLKRQRPGITGARVRLRHAP
jgi:hypothetical protein